MTPIDFSNLEKKSKTINQRSDELSAALAKIQEKLNSLNLGIEVFLSDLLTESYQPDQKGRICTTTVLGYGKYGDKWCLLVRESEYFEMLDHMGDVEQSQPLGSHYSPLLSASRKLRLLALDQIEDLIEALEREADKLDETVSKANEIANEL